MTPRNLGSLFLHESFGLRGYAGKVIILAAVALVQLWLKEVASAEA